MRIFRLVIAIGLLCMGGITEADVFNMSPGLTSLKMVTVGDPGNNADKRYVSGKGYGSVASSYRISEYETTNAQYVEFLNAKAKNDIYGLYDTMMSQNNWGCKIVRSNTSGNYSYSVAADNANRPVNFVSYWDAARFVNWLNNGQGDGSTETGAYDLLGYNGNDGRTITRNNNAKWYLPSEDEWYKAAYYKGGGTNSGYWDYPTQSNTAPANKVLAVDPGNSANYTLRDSNNYTYPSINGPFYRTNVGEFENSKSAYGTYDQGGNVMEWTDSVINAASHRVAGGSFGGYDVHMKATSRNWYLPNSGSSDMGFRIAGVQAVPEPATLLGFGLPMLMLGLGRLRGLRK